MNNNKSIDSLLAKFKKKGSAKSVPNNLLTVEEVANKYFKNVSKAQIEKYVQMMRASEVEDFKKLFIALKNGQRLIGRIYKGVDKGNNPYHYINFFSAGGNIECKLFPLGKLEAMLLEYQRTKFAINFKAEDLVEHIFNR